MCDLPIEIILKVTWLCPFVVMTMDFYRDCVPRFDVAIDDAMTVILTFIRFFLSVLYLLHKIIDRSRNVFFWVRNCHSSSK